MLMFIYDRFKERWRLLLFANVPSKATVTIWPGQ
jgi:hypothetical protein